MGLDERWEEGGKRRREGRGWLTKSIGLLVAGIIRIITGSSRLSREKSGAVTASISQGSVKNLTKKYFLSAALLFTMCRKYLMPHHSNYNIFCSVEKNIFLINFPFRARVLYLGPGCGSMNNSLFFAKILHEAFHKCLLVPRKAIFVLRNFK